MGSFNRKSEFRRSENLNKPITKGEKFNVAELSLLREFRGNNCAHVIWTAQVDSRPTDEKELREDYGLLGCHSSRSDDLSVHARFDSTGYVRLLWESSEKDDKNTQAAIFEIIFGKMALVTTSCLRPRCLEDTKERQLVTKSGPQRLRCCVCHLHHEGAMSAPASVRQFFKTVLQQVHRFKVDVIAGDVNAAAYKYYKRQECQHLHNSSIAIMPREMNVRSIRDTRFDSRRHIDYFYRKSFFKVSSANDLDCCFMAILSCGKPPGPRIKRKLSSNTRERTQGNEKRQGDDSSYPKAIEDLLRATARQNYPKSEKR